MSRARGWRRIYRQEAGDSRDANMRIHFLLLVTATAVLVPLDGQSQTVHRRAVHPEVFSSVAWGHLFRFEDETFGDELNVGAGIGFRVARFGAEVEVNRTLGLTPAPAPCGIRSCIGSARHGVRSASIASVNALYHFSDSRVQPYLTGGIGGLWSRTVHSVLTGQGDQGTFSEFERSEVGIAINMGAGLRFVASDLFSIRPEIRFYDSSVHSRENLALVRTSVAAALRW